MLAFHPELPGAPLDPDTEALISPPAELKSNRNGENKEVSMDVGMLPYIFLGAS